MRRVITVLLCFVALAAAVIAAPTQQDPTLFAYQASNQYWNPKGQGPKISIVESGQRDVSFVVHRLRSLPLRDGAIEVERLPDSALGQVVHAHVERWRDATPANPKSRLHRGASGLEGDYRLPIRDEGAYLLTVSNGVTQLRFLYFVSPLGVVVNHTRDVVAGYVYDQKAAHPLAGATVDVWNGPGHCTRVKTDARGTFRVPLTRTLEHRLTVVASDRSSRAVYSEGVYGTAAAADQLYLFTDRPLYRGGHTVYFKGTAERAGAVAADQALRIEVRDAANHVLLERDARTNRFGSFHGELTLPEVSPTGEYNVVAQWGPRRFYQSFTVRQYRKPWFDVKVKPQVADVRLQQPFTVSLTAESFTGMPVARGKAHVVVTAAPRVAPGPPAPTDLWELRSAPLLDAPKTVSEQDVSLDDKGMGTVTVKTEAGETDFDYTVTAEVQDAEHHQASASATVLVTRASLQTAAWLERDLVAPGDAATVFLRATTMTGAPCATAMRLRVERADFPKMRSTPTWSATALEGQATTDADGRAKWSFKVPVGGYYRVVAEARDESGRPTVAHAFFWTSGGGTANGQASLELVSDRRSYRVGDTAHVLINSGLKDAWVYLTIEGTTVHEQRVFRLQGGSGTCEIPVTPKLSPGFYVHASIVQGGQYLGGALALAVPDRNKILDVSVQPLQSSCRPGDETTWQVRIKDVKGKPVETEFSLQVVDEALLALQADTTQDPRAFFYGRRQNDVVTGYTVSREVTGGSYQNVPQRPRPQTDVPRHTFRDTAYWNPVLTTGADGTATVKVPLPENLTRWRGTVRAITPTVQVGLGQDTLVARKALMVRLAAPRFMRVGDRLAMTAEVQNLTDRPQSVVATLVTSGAEIADAGPRTVKVAAKSSGQVTWTVVAPAAGPERIGLKIQARAPETGLADGERFDIPVRPYGQEVVIARAWRKAATTPGSALDDRFTLPAGSARRVTLRLAPSIAAAALGGLDTLVTYPYGCTEQTMSSFLPDVAVASVLKRTGLRNATLEGRLPAVVRAGLVRLYGYQHDDGGWGWWERDESDGRMTAYVVYGLALACRAGHPVAPEVMRNGREWLLSRVITRGDLTPIDDEEDLFALRAVTAADAVTRPGARVRGKRTAGPPPNLTSFVKRAGKLGPFGLALLADALANQGRLTEARRVLDLAWQRGVPEGETLFHWRSVRKDDQWGNSDVEVTAALLATAVRLAPADPRVAQATAWLMQARQGEGWGTTRTTALALLALGELMGSTRERTPRYDARVTVNGHAVGDIAVTPDQPLDKERVIEVPASALIDGENVVRIEASGAGVVYVSRDARAFVPEVPRERESGISVKRRWQVRDARGGWADATRPLRAGEDVRVVLDVSSPDARAHVLVEDPLPAGFEVTEADDVNPTYNRRDVLDDRVAFFFTHLESGITTITYRGVAENGGQARVMSTIAEMMYLPSVRGQSAGTTLEVKP